MLTIYYSREHIDKDRFMYGRIGDTLTRITAARTRGSSAVEPDDLPKRILLIVPEQYTLQAERSAFEHTGLKGFIDFDVLSMSSLMRRIFAELGGGNEPFLDQYGKFMLISRLVYRRKHDMLSFRNLERSEAFISRMNDMISDLKNACVSPDALKEITADMKGESLLKRKLTDVSAIYAAYEEAVSGKFLDTPDRLQMIAGLTDRSDFIAGAQIWFSGFDYFSPAIFEVITGLVKNAAEVNIVLTAEPGNPFFFLTNALLEKLTDAVKEAGCVAESASIPAEFAFQKPAEILKIERELFSYGKAKGDDSCASDAEAKEDSSCASDAELSQAAEAPTQAAARPVLRLVAAANYYAEAETAAAQIAAMIRDDGLRYRDILVLCNDMTMRAPIIRRVFNEYGLRVFLDSRRDVSHNPVLRFILTLPEIAANGRRYEDVFALLKTGLTGIPQADMERLENYVIKYKIAGNRWRRAFTLGKSGRAMYSDEALDQLNVIRASVSNLLDSFEEDFKSGKTARERTEALLHFLRNDAQISEAAETMAAKLESDGRLEEALEVAAVPEAAEEVLIQMIDVLGDLPMSMAEYAVVLRAGFAQIRIGILPPAMDQIVIGTMQRTRTGDAKAIFVLGANDGVLPAESADDGILNEDEKLQLADLGRDIVRSDDFIHAEEQLAIYRNLCKPQQFLYMSYSIGNEDGKELRPSLIFERMRRIFPDIEVEKDILSAETVDAASALYIIQAKDEALHHMTENLRRRINGEMIPAVWSSVWRWFRAHDPAAIAGARAGLTFRNRHEHIDEKYLQALYDSQGAVITTSPSALERFSRCPFSWFLGNGLRLDDRRVHEIDPRSIGDLAHAALMRYGMEMSADGISQTDASSLWQRAEESKCRNLAEHMFDEIAADFQEGLLSDGGYERYKADRIRRTVSDAAWALTLQARSGSIESMFFESGFGQGGVFPPIESDADGKTVRVRGRIDRVDVLEGGYARIIDYKTGAESFSRDDIQGGWQLQLMVYLKAAAASYKPAGVFYFKIAEPRIKDDGKIDLAEAAADLFKLDGIYLNDPAVAAALGESGAGKNAADPADFSALQQSAGTLIEALLTRIADGDIAADPMTAKKLKTADGKPKAACTYCAYRGVCNYDKIFE
jgi:ATP-dependent helicase/nuclease subunit B